MKRATFPLLTLLLYACVAAVATEQLLIRRIGLDQGLPQSDVHAIAQSSDGFIWIATQDGLCRYDGERLAVYRNFSPIQGLRPSNGVRSILPVEDGGLIVLAGDVWLRYRPRWDDFVAASKPAGYSYHDPTDPQNTLLHLTSFTDSRGCKWYGTRHFGASMVDPKTNKRIDFNTSQPPERRLAADEVWTIAEDKYGRVWIGTHGGGITIVSNGRIVQTIRYDSDDQRTLPSDIVRSIFRDRSGVMWIGTYAGGLGIWDPAVSQLKLYRWRHTSKTGEDDYVRCFAINSKGHVYVGTRTGIVMYDKDRVKRTAIATWPLERFGAVEGLYVDRFDNLWLGTQRKGLGLIKAGTSTIRWFDGPQWRRGRRIRSISWITAIDSDTILLGTHSQIGVMTIQDPEPTWIPIFGSEVERWEMAPVSNIFRIAETGELVVSTDAGLLRGRLTTGFTKVECSDPNAIRPNVDYARAVQRRGDTLYIGTWGAGIRKIHLPSWRETVLDSRGGLPSNTIYVAIPREDGSLVASSNAGIIFIRPDGQVVSAGTVQGAQANEFNTGAWSILDDGTILLGGVSGFNSIQPELWLDPGPAPKIYIRRIDANGERQVMKNWTPRDGINMSPGSWNITIEFGSVATSRPTKVQYRFRLLPDDTTWTYTDVPVLSYLQLPHGKYTLQIESSFGTLNWGACLSMPIVIAARPWQNPWVVTAGGIILVLSLVAMTTVINRRQARKEVEREQLLNAERERIARDLHDDVGAGLARIVILTDELAARDHIQTSEINRLSEMARYVIESVRSIVWVIKTTDVSLKTTILFVRDKADEALYDRGISLRHEIAPDLPDSPLSILARRNSILACQEAVTNIIRHSGATQVMMRARYGAGEVVIEFVDNGVGLTTIGTYRSNGIDNMRTRMREIEGRFEISALPEGGTKVTFTIPCVT